MTTSPDSSFEQWPTLKANQEMDSRASASFHFADLKDHLNMGTGWDEHVRALRAVLACSIAVDSVLTPTSIQFRIHQNIVSHEAKNRRAALLLVSQPAAAHHAS